jgi:release factor glutamine methyltransferase
MNEEWTVRRIIDWTTAHLKKHGSDTPRLDAEILLAHARGCRRIDLYTRFDEVLTEPQRAQMRDFVRRRAQSEPVAYLVGHREFFSIDLRVTPEVLIPRPDTETLVVELLDAIKSRDAATILDVGTGSGCIAIAAALNHPAAQITATDTSAAALAVARKNAEILKLADRIGFREGNLFSPLDKSERFDAIVSNPPYIADHEKETLQNDVRRYEPHDALFAGPTGLEVISRLIEDAPSYLAGDGTLLLEIAPEQAAAAKQHMESRGYTDIRIVKDLASQARVVRGKWGE